MFDRFRLIYRLRATPEGIHVVAGRVPPRFLAAVRDIARLHGIDCGEIECKGRARHARLRFSDDFPKTGRQAIRNVWTPPTAPGPSGGRRARG
ncbi:hypothetical protein T5B8_10782 [Salinisphaera sp. T5B8]|uniref:DUF3634 family protein n=1 Tax=unclassified Salinisphaera TaxID=2649847 RepID=UPI0033421A69